MTTCRTPDEAYAAGAAAARDDPPLSQEQVNYIAAILAPYRQHRRQEITVPAPACRTVEEAYQAGIRDTLANPQATAELAERIVATLAPWLEVLAAARGPKLVTIAQAAEQLGMSRTMLYELVYKGEIPSVEIPSDTGRRSTRRVEQSAIDAFIDRHRVTGGTTPGAVPPPCGSRL